MLSLLVYARQVQPVDFDTVEIVEQRSQPGWLIVAVTQFPGAAIDGNSNSDGQLATPKVLVLGQWVQLNWLSLETQPRVQYDKVVVPRYKYLLQFGYDLFYKPQHTPR